MKNIKTNIFSFSETKNMNKKQLIQLLAQQIRYAKNLDGHLSGDDDRRQACDEANRTLHLLETKFHLDPELVYYQAEELALCNCLPRP